MIIKRIFDIVVSALGLVILLPAITFVAVLVKIDSPGPVFYRGVRGGLHGSSFRIYKFRTMIADAENVGGPSTSATDVRITRVGSFLRRYKIDEMPQFINVFLGDMSLVGPRPEVKMYIDLYTDEEKVLLQLKPGITDWASIWNNDEAALLAGYPDTEKAYLELVRPQKIELQLKYYRERSFGTDMAILWKTFSMLFSTRTHRTTEGI